MKVLVFGDDAGPCLAVARSLGRLGAEVHLTTRSGGSAASRSRYVKDTHPLPLYTGNGSHWIRAVQELCASRAFTLLIPTSDSSLEQLLGHRGDLEGAALAVPNEQAAACFTDKLRTRRLAEDLGIPIAPGSTIESSGGIGRLGRDLGLPVVLKRHRSYARGDRDQKSEVVLVDSPLALQGALATGRFDLAEAFLPGFCRGLSVIANDGKILVAHQHRRLAQKHATGPSSLRVSEACDPQLLEWTKRMVAAVNLTGVAMFEFRHDPRSGRTVLLEVNPRFWGSLPLAVAAGADFPALLAAMVVDRQEPPLAIGSRPGVRRLNLQYERHALALAFEQAGGWADRLRWAAQALRFACHLAWGRQVDSWAPDDPAAFRAERRELLNRLRSALRKRLGSVRPTSPEPAE